ncbi:MAG: LacI family DNA-binding transcriptional regulator [Anaerolineae bacterium]
MTIADVAREAGVSQQTVSRVLNNKAEISPETRARVLKVIERLGYRPSLLARGLVTHKTMTLGLVVPDIANPFFSEVARGAEDVAHAAGYNLFLCNTIEDPAREMEVLRSLEAQHVDGIVLCSSRLSDQQLAAVATALPALVLVNRRLPESRLSSICVDDERGACDAMNHLIGGGRRNIGLLAGPPASRSGHSRRSGYAAALAAAGRPLEARLIQPCAPDLDGGRAAATALLRTRPEIDALFCYNDLVAVGALQACATEGRRVPEDVAVVGCDDILLARLVTPALTTLRSDQRRLGALAVEAILRQINGCPDGCEDVLLQPRLIVRASAP